MVQGKGKPSVEGETQYCWPAVGCWKIACHPACQTKVAEAEAVQNDARCLAGWVCLSATLVVDAEAILRGHVRGRRGVRVGEDESNAHASILTLGKAGRQAGM